MSKPVPLQPDGYYHIYNRGNNRENLFLEERNYHHFLKLYARYVTPVANTYAYCLLKNHFHVLVQIKALAELAQPGKTLNPSQQFGHLFNAYSKAINKAYRRTGSLFEHPFERIEVTSERYLLRLVTYIHHNPQKHGLPLISETGPTLRTTRYVTPGPPACAATRCWPGLGTQSSSRRRIGTSAIIRGLRRLPWRTSSSRGQTLRVLGQYLLESGANSRPQGLASKFIELRRSRRNATAS